MKENVTREGSCYICSSLRTYKGNFLVSTMRFSLKVESLSG